MAVGEELVGFTDGALKRYNLKKKFRIPINQERTHN